MTKEEKSRYSEPEALRDILKRVLAGRKFLLDCGHHVSFRVQLGKRHDRNQRTRVEDDLVGVRALIGLSHQYSRKAESEYMADIRRVLDHADLVLSCQ